MAFLWRSWCASNTCCRYLNIASWRDARHSRCRKWGDAVRCLVSKDSPPLFQFIGAALALPAGAAGVYSAYHSYFSPEVMCREMRNTALATLEKNIPAEAKLVLLRKDVTSSRRSAPRSSRRPARYSMSPFTNWKSRRRRPDRVRAVLHRLRKTFAAPRPAAIGSLGCAASLPLTAAPAASSSPAVAAAPVAAPAVGGVLGRRRARLGRDRTAQGRQAGRVLFLGYAANGQSLPPAGTVADRDGVAADLVGAAGARPERSDQAGRDGSRSGNASVSWTPGPGRAGNGRRFEPALCQ